jgi:hypothetical protein
MYLYLMNFRCKREGMICTYPGTNITVSEERVFQMHVLLQCYDKDKFLS